MRLITERVLAPRPLSAGGRRGWSIEVVEGGLEDVGELSGEGFREGGSVVREVVKVPIRRGCGRRTEGWCGGLFDMMVVVMVVMTIQAIPGSPVLGGAFF